MRGRKRGREEEGGISPVNPFEQLVASRRVARLVLTSTVRRSLARSLAGASEQVDIDRTSCRLLAGRADPPAGHSVPTGQQCSRHRSTRHAHKLAVCQTYYESVRIIDAGVAGPATAASWVDFDQSY